ncbi:hypothetical protein RJ639_005289 [Escallonia herrerae]|uniref:C3H1-type domain-containing protein n=1 Tax=Escallonia herrerae TaxID=1293975 RepID=A0AA88VXI7_9ASTE|nr:hypothetical protein RJ639_005289 [Escallonia herrerae]
MDYPSFHHYHQIRYASSRPDPNLHQQHHFPPLPPPPPPPSYPILPPAPPPPPLFLPHQSQFTFLSNHQSPSRVSNRAAVENLVPRLNYPDPRPDPIRAPPEPFTDYRRPISPYRPADSFSLDLHRNFAYRDESIDDYRGNIKRRDDFIDSDVLSYRDNHVSSVADRLSRGNVPNSIALRDFESDFVNKLQDYEPIYGSRQSSREIFDGPMGIKKFKNDDGRVSHFYDSGKSDERGREKREEYKQVQKKSVLLRIGKPNSNRNRSLEHYSSNGMVRSKDKDAIVYADHRVENKVKKIPVELDVSFKSNALVAKAIVAPTSPVVLSDGKLTPRNWKIRKLSASDSPLSKFSLLSVKSGNSGHGSDFISSSENAPNELAEKVTDSGNKGMCCVGSKPSSSGTNECAVSSAVKVTKSDQSGKSGGSNKTPPYQVRKRKKVTAVASALSSLQSIEKDVEPAIADSSRSSPSAAELCVLPINQQLSSTSNESAVDKADEPPRDLIVEKDKAVIDSGRLFAPDTDRDLSVHHMDASSLRQIGIHEGTENVDRSVSDMQLVSSPVNNINELQGVSSVSDTERLDHISQQLCQNELPFLSENDSVKGSSSSMFAEGNGNFGFSLPEKMDTNEGLVGSRTSVEVARDFLSFVYRSTNRQECFGVSDGDPMDVSLKQSSVADITTPLGNGVMEGFLDLLSTVEGSNILDSSNAKEKEGSPNANGSKHEFGTISSSTNDLSSYQVTPNSLLVDDNGSTQLLKNGFVEGSVVDKVLKGDNFNLCCGNKSSPNVKSKWEIWNVKPGSLSPRRSETAVNVFGSVVDVNTSLSRSVTDLVPAEEEVRHSGALDSHDDSQLCKDGDNIMHCDRLDEGASEVDVVVRDGVNIDPERSSPKNKKRKVFAPVEKPVSEDGIVSSESSRINMNLGHIVKSNLSINNKTISFPSQNTSKTSLTLNPARGQSNTRNNQPTPAVPRVYTGRSSLVFSGKKAPTNHNAKSRTWHRTDNPSVAPPAAKQSFSRPLPPQTLPPKTVGEVPNSSYVRKGNCLVRRHAPVTSVHHGYQASSSAVYWLNPSGVSELEKSSGAKGRVNGIEPTSCLESGSVNAPLERPRTPPIPCSTQSLNCTITLSGDGSLPRANSSPNDSSETTLAPVEFTENIDVPKFSDHAPKAVRTPEHETGSTNNAGSQMVPDEGNLGKKITYVKRKSNQLVAAPNTGNPSVEDLDKNQASDSYYKRKKNQLIRTPLESNITKGINLCLEGQQAPKVIPSRSICKIQFGKGSGKVYNKSSKLSSVWTLSNAQSLEKDGTSLKGQKVRPYLFPWKRATYWRHHTSNSASISSNSSLSIISRKLLLSRKRETIYTRSGHGLSLRISKLLSVGGSSLKWSKSIERNSKRANEEATLAVAAVEKKKREQKGAARAVARTKNMNHFSRKRIFRIGSVRYKMDPTRRTLQRISGEEPSCSASLQPEMDAKKSYVPRRLLIGHDEYVRIGNGNQLIRDPKKRTRTFASEKVRWSLHTARSRLARKRKYCQFFTRFGKCDKDDGKCPYIHDPSKIAVCTKYLNGSCSNANCKLTHKVIPERMQDCSYFLQGLCSNGNCPYRHVNVNPNASICEGFLKGYCADCNECRKKHTYVCPTFEATGVCPQGSRCKLHHPKKRSKGVQRKPSRQQKNARGRYFGSRTIDIDERRAARSETRYSKEDDDIFCQEGKFSEYIALDVSDEEAIETNDPLSERSAMVDSDHADFQVSDLDELTKPIRVMGKKLSTESSTEFDNLSEKASSFVSVESNCR